MFAAQIQWHNAPKFVIARRPKADVAISQYLAASRESNRRKRNCLPEIATGAKRPRNDNSGTLARSTMPPNNLQLPKALTERRYMFLSPGGLPQRTPLQTQLARAILTLACAGRQHCAGRDMPLPYMSLYEKNGPERARFAQYSRMTALTLPRICASRPSMGS